MALLAKLDLVYHFADVAGITVEALKESESLVDRQLLGELRILELDSEQLAQILLVSLPPPAKYFDIAGIRRQKSLADLDGRRFSGAVGTKQPKAFAGIDMEIQAVDSNDIAIRFAESPDLQRRRGQLSMCHHRGTRVQEGGTELRISETLDNPLS